MVTRPIPVAGFEEFPIELEGNIPRRFESQAARHPDRIAIEAGQQSWTYRTLNESANRIARAILHTQESSDPVALFFAPGFDAIAGILGVLKSGRAWFPMLPGGPSERSHALLMDAGSVLVLTDCDHIEEAATLVGHGTEVVAIECVIGSGNGENLGLDITPDTASNIIYTSGSTGRPKGVVHTHTIVLNNIMVHTNTLYLTCEDRICQAASYTTLAGTSSIFRALLNGATLLPFDTAGQGPASFAHWLIEKRVTVCQIVPTLFRSMIQSSDEAVKFPHMRVLHLGGEPVYRSDVLDYRKRFPNTCCLLHNLGSSEATTIRQYFIDHDTPIDEETVPVGYPVPDREVLLVDETGKSVDLEQVGEIVVRSAYLSPGYWHNPELTAAKFKHDPEDQNKRLYYTGDLGLMLPEGCLVHKGRKDDWIKIRGYGVDLNEVEAALRSHKAIRDAVVVDRKDKSGKSRLAAYFTSLTDQGPTAPTAHELRKCLGNVLADYMIPSVFVRMEVLPLTATGKLDRKALPEPDQKRPELSALYSRPRNETEQILVQIWEEVLDVSPIGINDDFFDLGGHSLSATQVISQVIKRFQLEIPLQSLFQSPTIAEMAAVITEHQGKMLDESQLATILDELATLSDAEAHRLVCEINSTITKK
ncbi:MAG TPA: non-ribosomal peptide synthetase [Pyrinomonadaceae bacterium]|jgi:amino acid adenylation domain-containing protein|nr:non-ribosomal peptide synthetase [Pyrinomonadaceae bacterium]